MIGWLLGVPCEAGAGLGCADLIPISGTGALLLGVEDSLAPPRYFSGEAVNFVAQPWQQK